MAETRPGLLRQKTVYVTGNGPTQPITDFYKWGKNIGTPGNFGKAVVVVSKTEETKGQKFCCKVVNKAKFHHVGKLHRIWNDMRQEISVLKEMDHVNVVKFYNCFETRNELMIVTELCTGKELFERISARGQYKEKDAAGIFAQLLEGMKYLHEKGIVHCDLKPDNFIFKDGAETATIKIIDFGMSKRLPRREKLNQLCGTPYYTAPEIIDKKYAHSADMWSLGVVLFVMIFGYPPFYVDPAIYGRKENEMIFKKIKRGFSPKTKNGYGSHFPAAIPVSENVKDLIAHLLQTNPAKRLTAQEALDHEWVRLRDGNESVIPSTVLEGIVKFQKTNRFKNLVCHAFRDRLHPSQVKATLASFKQLDTNGDGYISKEEFVQVMQSQTEGDAAELFHSLDDNSDGKISYDELVAATFGHHVQAQDERLYEQFTSLDTNGDGFITSEELEQGLRMQMEQLKSNNIEVTFTLQQAKEALKEIDANLDGKIDYNEFLAALYPDLNEKFIVPDLPESDDEEMEDAGGPPTLSKGKS